MRKRDAANRTFRWALLAGCLVVFYGLARLFWSDASDGRGARAVDRIEGSQDQVQEVAPAVKVPAAPAQQ